MKPADITANRYTNQMTITWSDGHLSAYSFSLVRHACPCAECRGGHEKMGSQPDPLVFNLPDENNPSTQIRDIAPVGTYALTIAWEDGHHFGIYNWRYLRALCPCPDCRRSSPAGEL